MAKIIPAEEKVFMVSKSTNTTYSGSTALKAMSEWYTMEDVTNTIRPYKVYTALLTQSGGDNNFGLNSGTLVIGTTYYINDNSGNPDFTNVGAPNNNVGTYFVATGENPNTWGISVSIGGVLTYNTGAPVATVLENAIGDIWFTYYNTGEYAINSNSLFITSKTFAICPANTGQGNTNIVGNNLLNAISLGTSDFNNDLQDNLLYNTSIEIRVYN
jgi:hypothetical protein